MPHQLKSGRHVALSASPYLNALTSETDESKFFAIVALRFHAPTPEALRAHLVVGYFVAAEGTPPNAPCHASGYCLADVLEGRTDWTADEIEEYRNILDNEPYFKPWLQAQFDAIDNVIQDNLAWDSGLLAIDLASNDADVRMTRLGLIMDSAMGPDAMRQMRESMTAPSA